MASAIRVIPDITNEYVNMYCGSFNFATNNWVVVDLYHYILLYMKLSIDDIIKKNEYVDIR